MTMVQWAHFLRPGQVSMAALALLLTTFVAIRLFQSRRLKLNVPVADVVKNDWKATILNTTTKVCYLLKVV